MRCVNKKFKHLMGTIMSAQCPVPMYFNHSTKRLHFISYRSWWTVLIMHVMILNMIIIKCKCDENSEHFEPLLTLVFVNVFSWPKETHVALLKVFANFWAVVWVYSNISWIHSQFIQFMNWHTLLRRNFLVFVNWLNYSQMSISIIYICAVNLTHINLNLPCTSLQAFKYKCQ